MGRTTAETLVGDLQSTLVGDLAPFAKGLLSAAPSSAVPSAVLSADELLLPAHIADILSWLEARLGVRPDRRAALSIWAGWHFRCIIPPLMAANILFDVSPRLDLDSVKFVISDDLRADRIVILTLVDDVSDGNGLNRFASLIDVYLKPLIHLLASRSEVTERVLWSNAGHVFEGFLRSLAGLAHEKPGVATARQLLKTSRWANGNRNPLFEPVRDIGNLRVRRVCCLRYRFPDGKLCGSCPLQLQSSRTGRPRIGA